MRSRWMDSTTSFLERPIGFTECFGLDEVKRKWKSAGAPSSPHR